jgi:L-asparaginase II
MTQLQVETVRGPLVESIHRVSAVVVDANGSRVAWSGDPDLVTFWRSAAKPFQAIPILEDGAADAFGLLDDELALACASHSSEPVHLATVDRFLEKIGCQERQLGCGGHTPLSEAVAADVAATGQTLTPRWSNCSGNHAGMLALARHHGWPTEGYYRQGHPVQERHLDVIGQWTNAPREEIVLGLDGCNTVCFGMPLSAMALGYARLGAASAPAPQRVVGCMTGHPRLVGGELRPCTDIMAAAGGDIVAKIGAEGVYGASVVTGGLGIALKVEDGGMRSAPIALIAILDALAERGLWSPPGDDWGVAMARHGAVGITNTRGEVTGALRAAGAVRFSA